MDNRQYFLFKRQAESFIKFLVPMHASKAEVLKDDEGYWINVWWHCNAITPMTTHKMRQALGEQ